MVGGRARTAVPPLSISRSVRRSDIPEHIILVIVLIIRNDQLALKQSNVHVHITFLHEGGIRLGQAVIALEQLAT